MRTLRRIALVSMTLVLASAVSARAEVQSFPTPLVKAGFRYNSGNQDDYPTIFYLGAQLSILKIPVTDHWKLLLLSPGANLQNGDQKISASISPVAVAGDSGLSAGFDLFPFAYGGRKGGILGVFLGYSIEFE